MELRDLYDDDKKPTNKTIKKGKFIKGHVDFLKDLKELLDINKK